MLNAFTLGRKPRSLVKTVDRAVKFFVSSEKVGRHQIRIIELGKSCFQMLGAGIKDGLRKRFQL